MKFFRKKRRENKAKVIVYDVRLASPHRRVIKLRERIWTFTFDLKIGKLWKFITRHRLAFGTLLLFFLVGGGLLNNYLASRAQLAIYYPHSALGSWKHPENAQGEPQLDKKSKPEKFTEENSALLDKKESELYLGNFQGEIPESSLPQGFFLSFIWNVSSRNTDKDILAVSYTLDNSDWKELGKVSPQGKPSTFELPLTKWDDLSKVQISVKSTSDFGDATKVYLDGVTLGVEYQEISGQESLSQEEIDKLPKKEISSDKIFQSPKKDFQSNEEVEFEIKLPDSKTLESSTEVVTPEAEVSKEPEPPAEEPAEEEPAPPAGEAAPEEPAVLPETINPSNNPAPETNPDQGNLTELSGLPEAPSLFWREIKNILKTETARAASASIASLEVTGPDGLPADIYPQIDETSSGTKIFIPSPGRDFKPGKYTLTIGFVSNGTLYSSAQDFTWGVLAINTNKSIYAPNEEGNLAMAVLDEQGDMVCNAEVTLRIKNSKLNIDDELSTSNGKITVNPECSLKGFTLIPDYEAKYRFGGTGEYALELTAVTLNGTYSITDSIQIKKEVPFDVERITATRIYPPENYPVTLSITANEDFKGEIQEEVPASFDITKGEGDYQKYDQEETSGDTKVITWKADIKKGDKITLGYEFKAPPVSPEFYLLGPFRFIQEDSFLSFGNGIVFEEARVWQVASDANTISVIGTPQTGSANNGGAVTLTWSTQPSQNDVTVVIVASPAATPAACSVSSPSGYQTLKTFTGTGNTQPTMAVFYKVQTATPDTNVVVVADGAGTTDTAAIGYVLRGVDISNVSDQTPTTAGVTTGANPNPAQIVTQTNEAWVIAAATSVMTTLDTAPGTIPNYSNQYEIDGNDTYDHEMAAATFEKTTAGTEDPGAWDAWTTGNWYAITVAIRPEFSPTTVLNSPDNASSTSDTTPTLNFTGTDVNLDTLEYNVQVDTQSDFNSGGDGPLLSKFSVNGSGDFTAGHPFTQGTAIDYTVQSGDTLSPGTYYWRVAAIDPSGSNTYGTWATYRSFTVTGPPTVTTQDATDVTETSATGNGNITSNGGQTITEKGVCYMTGTSGDPTTANSTFHDHVDSTGAFTESMTSLTAGTSYRVRAYAINASGTAYGTTVQMATLQPFVISGTTDEADGVIVRAAINGSLATQTATVATGAWSISGITKPSANAIITVFATDADGDIADSLESSAVGKYSGSGAISDIVLNINVLSIGGVGNQSISVSDMVTSNYDSDQDEDIMFDAETGSFLVEAAVNTYTAEKIDVLTTDTLTVSGSETLTTYDLTITGTLTSGGASIYNVTHNWTNNGTFTASSSTVNLNGTTQQTLSGTLNSTSAFYNLTITNNSGTNPSDNEITDFVPSVIFSTSTGAKITNDYAINAAHVRVSYYSGYTYEFANINWAGTSGTGNQIYFRNSAITGTWNLKVTGTQTAVSYVNVSRSYAAVSGGSAIVASDGTNYNAGNNTNWSFTSANRLHQEINILDSTYSSAGESNEIIYIDPAKYGGSLSYKFEIVAKVTSGTGTVTLHDSSNNVHATLSVTATEYTKSTVTFSTAPTADNYHINLSGGTGLTVQAARAIVVQDSGSSIDSTESQIEVGNNETAKTNTASAPLTYPKYWLYTPANWGGTKTFSAEVSYISSNVSGNVTITLQKDNSGDLSTWSDVATIVNAQHPTVATLATRVTFTPVSGCNYRIAAYISSASYNYSIYNAKIVVDQTGGTAWNISGATNPGSKSFATSTQDASARKIFLKPDGTKMYMIGDTGDSIYQYSLGTPGDISTATYDTVSKSVAAKETGVEDLFFSSDGTKVYVLGSVTGKSVYQYSLSTAWDLNSTFTWVQTFAMGQGETAPHGLFFNSDGTKMYISGSGSDNVYQYSLSTGWDISTASWTKTKSIIAQDTASRGVFFSSDGTKMYLAGNNANPTQGIYQYNLVTAWDVTTAVYNSVKLLVAAQDTTPQGLFLDSDGKNLYMTGNTSHNSFQYPISTAWDISTASYNLNYVSVASYGAGPQGIFFKSDGLTLYVVGDTSNVVYQYTLSTAWDVTTAAYASKSKDVSAQTDGPKGIFFNTEGNKMYIVGDSTANAVYQYSLSIGWDLGSTVLYVQSLDLTAAPGPVEATPNGIFFTSDGTKMYIAGSNADKIWQTTLSTGWDISSVGSWTSIGINPPESAVRGLFFSSDGYKMYFTGDNAATLDLYQYALSTAWDVTTATSSATKDLGIYDSAPTGLFFKPDGKEIYVAGNTGGTVIQFSDTPITTLEGQYLLANTNQDSIGLKDFDTAWNPDDWISETSVFSYYHEIDTSSSTGDSAKLQSDPNGTPANVTNSTATGAFRARSSQMTMPVSAATLDVNVLDAPIYASRIIVLIRPPSAPIVTSPTATSVAFPTATLGATVTSDGGATLTARGTCWGTSPSPTTNCSAEGGTGTGTFTQSRTGITTGVAIYYRGYATNSIGTSYSADGILLRPPNNAVQYKSDHSTVIATGGGTPDGVSNNDYLDFSVTAGSSETVTPKVEIRNTGTAFTDTSNATGDSFDMSPAVPRFRTYAATIYDSANKRMIVFGGKDDLLAFKNDVWELKLPSTSNPNPIWRQLFPSGTAPTPRNAMVYVYDSTFQRLIIFGGNNGARMGGFYSLTLPSDSDGAWSTFTPSGTLPGDRLTSDGIFDSANQRMIIFGGFTTVDNQDAWKITLPSDLSTSASTLLAPTGTKPTARSEHSLIYDSANQRMILFAGWGAARYNDVWQLTLPSGNDGAWSQPTTSGTAPAIRCSHDTVYDATNQRMITFKGWNGTTYYNDIFELTLPASGTMVWTNKTSADGTLSGKVYAFSAIYDSSNARAVIFGGKDAQFQSNEPLAIDLPSTGTLYYNELSPTVNLMTGDGSEAIYDSTNNQMVRFGGYSRIYDADTPETTAYHINETWTYGTDSSKENYNALNNISPSVGPLARELPAVIYDSSNKRIVVFGGLGYNQDESLNDLWQMSLDPASSSYKTWTRLSASGTAPVKRWGSAVVYDPTNQRMILFGGAAKGVTSTHYKDVYQLSLTSGSEAWSSISPSGTGPSMATGLFQSTAVYDPGNVRMIIFGGRDGAATPVYYNTVWSLDWDNGTPNTFSWQSISVTGTPPAVRRGHDAIYQGDFSDKRMVVFGGFDGTNHYNDVYKLDITNANPVWSTITTLGTSPVVRRSGNAIYDPVNQRMIMQGGRGALTPVNFLSDFWELTLPSSTSSWTWTQLSPTTYLKASVPVTSLTAGTAYHWQAWSTGSSSGDSQKVSYGGNSDTVTAATDFYVNGPPTVTTQAVTDVLGTTATGNGNITLNGGAAITEKGVCYMTGTSGDPTTANSTFHDHVDSTGAFTESMTGLSTGTNYRVRAYAINSYGTSYGTTVQLTTNSVPTISPNTAVDYTFSTSTPTLNFTGSDADTSDTLEYNIQICSTSDCASPILNKFSATPDAGFTAGHPFTQGVAIDYTIQAGDALANGTYYWQAKAIDPGGTNTYSSWTTTPARRFYVSTGGGLSLDCTASAALANYTLGNPNNYNKDTFDATTEDCTVTDSSSAPWSLTIQSSNMTSTDNTIVNTNIYIVKDGVVNGSDDTITDATTGISETIGTQALDTVKTIISGDVNATGTYNNRPTLKLDNLNGLYNESTSGTLTITVS